MPTLDDIPVLRRARDRQQLRPRELPGDRAQLIDEAHAVCLWAAHLERERDRPAGTPADDCRKRIRSVKKLVARRD
jgi:hypothetical protein